MYFLAWKMLETFPFFVCSLHIDGLEPNSQPGAGQCLRGYQFSSVQLFSHVWLFVTPWTAGCQASLSIANSQSPPKPMSIESVVPSNHLILCHPLLLLPSIFPSIRVFSSESALHIRWPKYWEFQLQHQSFQWTPRTNLRCINVYNC